MFTISEQGQTYQASLNQGSLDLASEQSKQRDRFKKQPEPFTSAFFTDQTKERNVIEEAFSAGNFRYLRQLPDFIGHQSILDQQRERIEKMYHQNRNPRSGSLGLNTKQMTKLQGGGYFNQFEYTPIEYNYAKELNLERAFDDKKKQTAISYQPFIPTKNINKMKYEDPFNFLEQDKQEYLFPFHLPEDTYDVQRESDTRHRIIEEAKILAGSFVPAGKKVAYTKNDLDEIIRLLKDIIINDWPNLQLVIGVTNIDTIEVEFVMLSLTCKQGFMAAYMNSLINDERVCQYQLSRIIEKWVCGLYIYYYYLKAIKNQDLGTLLFTIKPPWVKIRINDNHTGEQSHTQKTN